MKRRLARKDLIASVYKTLPIKDQCPPLCIEPSQLIYNANQLTGFYMMEKICR